MKSRYLLLCVTLCLSIFSWNCVSLKDGEKNLDIYLVRHAEKEIGSNPSLSPEGVIRAKKLGDKLKIKKINTIYSSDYNRTKETASYVNEKQKNPKDLEIYNPSDLKSFYQEILNKHVEGETILIVGHSNTTPALANLFTKTEDYPSFDESDYSNLYLISINKSGEVNLKKLSNN